MFRPSAGPVEKLRRQKHIPRRIFFLQAADGCHANDPAHVERTERVDVGAMVQLVREQAMSASMSRQKIDLPPMHASTDDRVGWIAERRRDAALPRILHAFHLIEAAPTDDADRRTLAVH